MYEDDMLAAIGKRNVAKKAHEQAPTEAIVPSFGGKSNA
jgi:hypothetical protein